MAASYAIMDDMALLGTLHLAQCVCMETAEICSILYTWKFLAQATTTKKTMTTTTMQSKAKQYRVGIFFVSLSFITTAKEYTYTSNVLCARRNHKTHTPCTRNACGAQRALLEPPAVTVTAVTAAAVHNVQCHRLLWDVIYVMSIYYYYCVCGVHVHCTSTYPSGERKRQQQQQWASRKDNAGMVFSWKSNRFPSTNSIEQGAGPQLRYNIKCMKVDAIYILCTS